MRKCSLLGIVALVIVLSAAAAPASPTGLNNIPTAEVVDKDVLVLQGWGNFDGDDSWFAGFKYGLAENWEVGLDDLFAGAGASTGPALQAKYRIPLPHGMRAALGIANLTTDRDENGGSFPYLVVTAPLGDTVSGTVGYSFQSDNQARFAGANYCVSPQLNLRADWTQTNDGDDSVSSLGFITQLNDHWLAEAWASFPTAAGVDTNYTVKVDYVIPVTW